MSNTRKALMIALVLCLVGGAGSFLTFHSSDVNENTSFDAPITAIDVRTNHARVEIVPTREAKTKVEFSGSEAAHAAYRFSAEVAGTTLVIESKRRSWINFNFLLSPNTLKVYLPEKQYESLYVDSGNGGVATENVPIKEVNLNTRNGRIELRHVPATHVEVAAHNGPIVLADISGEIVAKARNGGISLATASLDRPLRLEADNGSIEIATEQKPTNAAFDVRVKNGRVLILDQYEGSTVIGNGDHVVRLQARNGNVSVKQQ